MENNRLSHIIALYLSLMHVAGADRPDQDAVAAVSLREHHERVAFLRCGSYRPKPSLALGIFFVGQNHNRSVKQAFNLSDRDSVFLALLAVASIPIKTRKIHGPPQGRQCPICRGICQYKSHPQKAANFGGSHRSRAHPREAEPLRGEEARIFLVAGSGSRHSRPCHIRPKWQ